MVASLASFDTATANFLGISIDAISSEKGVSAYEPRSLLRMGGSYNWEPFCEHLFEISTQILDVGEHRAELSTRSPFGYLERALLCMPSSTRSNKEKHLLFSEDPVHLERTIRKDQRSTSIDAAAFTSTDSRTHPSTDTQPSSSTDLHRSTSIDSTPRTSINPQSRNMVVVVILIQDENGDL
ncbi:hypothetical protein DY000_02007904 [Brassica cretica]|uniref:Uncharacterized protein n=1 Tax=Brassica cretica TaxID=69181 RepID=A0ABQ7CD41_BRACR|nr:hypothetical protein DY000_02007904 [Brassica cretica]